MSDLNNIAILILNYNSKSLTISNVDQLLLLDESLKIVIVDNSSTDDSYDTIRDKYRPKENVYVLKNKENNGYAAGNNYGLKFINNKFKEVEYVVIMNPDIFIPKIEILFNLRDVLENNKNISVISSSIIFNNQWRAFSDFGWKFPSYRTLCFSGTLIGKLLRCPVNELYSNCLVDKGLINVDVVSGCFFMGKISDLKKVDYFDESTFLYYEETILAKKLKKIGKHEAIALENFIYHNHQVKDKNVKNIKHKIFDRKCFHDSKMVYIKKYTNLLTPKKEFCLFINNFDYKIKQLIFKICAIFG